MNWKQLLADLRARGWTQQLIADRVGASQAAISDLNSGKTINPTYSLGRALEDLRKSGVAPEPADSVTPDIIGRPIYCFGPAPRLTERRTHTQPVECERRGAERRDTGAQPTEAGG